ncbi:MAG: hypothetical protein KIB08_04505 [Negativicoccus succinicivorans]|uniref:hypothetical protein n=1 Tax=Negativicoccus succinicivorans TaxID=620903 RepID=UPI0026ED36B5|nr:hypothetical protein [Negativicoccus succinicivorans]MBS5887763.1 hypothetical protein [Negativicoccus succinicivorans]
MEKELNLYVHFTENEIKFLNGQGVIIHQGEPINIDTAEKIVDELCAADCGVAGDIITKITTNENW